MSEKKEYEFTNHAEILKAIEEMYEIDSHPIWEIRKPLDDAIKQFLETRTNCELIDMRDMEPNFWDTEWLNDAWYKEIDKRSYPQSQEIRDILNQWHKEWADKDSYLFRFEALEKQVNGMQKKVDKIVKLLENFEIKMSVADALKL